MQVLLNHSCRGLLCPQPAVAGACYRILLRILPAVMEQWCLSAVEPSSPQDDQEEHLQLPYVLTRLVQQVSAPHQIGAAGQCSSPDWCSRSVLLTRLVQQVSAFLYVPDIINVSACPSEPGK